MKTKEGSPQGAAQLWTWVTHRLHYSGGDTGAGGTEHSPPAVGELGQRPAVLTTSTVPAMEMNSLVMISTISRTCGGGRGCDIHPALQGHALVPNSS